VEADCSGIVLYLEEFNSMSKALNLVQSFSSSKKEVLTFISNVNLASEVIIPNHKDRLYKFVLKRISAEPRMAIAN
jgi:hypothetical protein